MAKVSNKDIYTQDENLSMEDYLLGTNNGTANKKTQTYSLGSIFSLFYNFLGFNAFLNTTDTTTYPIGTPGCFYVFDENNDLTNDFALSRKITFSATDTYNFNVASYFDIIVNSNKFLFKLINLEDKNNFVFLAPSNFVLGGTGTTFDVEVIAEAGLSNGSFVNYKRYLLVLEFAAGTFDPADYDLSEFNNLSANPFVRNDEFQEVADDINSIVNPDRIITIGIETITGNEYSYEDYVWQLGGVQINNTGNPSAFIIPAATTGFRRKDISVFNNEGNIVRIAGNETDGEVASTPAVPPGTLYFKSYDINGDTIATDPEPVIIDGIQFKKKTESLGYGDPSLSGTNAVIQLRPEGNSRYAFSNVGLVSIDGFGLDLITGNPTAEAPYDGKDLFIENTGTTPITLLHDGPGTADSKFFFLDEQDLILPAGEKVWLKYGNPYCEVIFKSWGSGGGTTPTLQAVTDLGSVTSNTITIEDFGVSLVEINPDFVYISDEVSLKSISFFSDRLVLAQIDGLISLKPRTLTQNTDFYFEDEGGEKSIATREWVNAKNNLQWIVKDVTPTTAVTGTTLVTQIGSSVLMPANTFNAEDVMFLEGVGFEKTGTAGNCTIRVYKNTSDTLSGANLILTAIMAAANLASVPRRTFEIEGGFLKGLNATTATNSDLVVVNAARTYTPFDHTIDNYFFPTVQLGNASDSVVRTQLLISK